MAPGVIPASFSPTEIDESAMFYNIRAMVTSATELTTLVCVTCLVLVGSVVDYAVPHRNHTQNASGLGFCDPFARKVKPGPVKFGLFFGVRCIDVETLNGDIMRVTGWRSKYLDFTF